MPDSEPTFRPQTDKHRVLLECARKRWSQSVAAEQDIRREAELDLQYVLGDQWDAESKIKRDRRDRPMLVFNKLHTQVQQLANQARQNKPAIQVNPCGGGADRATADVNQGIIRHIEYASSADLAYDTALECAASCSLGWIKIGKVFDSDDSFEQNLTIEPVYDPFSVRMDPAAAKWDKSDAMWAFEEIRLSKEGYKERFGREPRGSAADFVDDLLDTDWIDDDTVRVCRYWDVELVPKMLREYVGDDGVRHAVYMEDLSAEEIEAYDQGTRAEWVREETPDGEPGEPRERTVQTRMVHQYVIDGIDVLEEDDWDGGTIPLIPVFGKRLVVKGKLHLISLIRFCRDPQKLHNYYKTIEAEIISLAPKPKWVGALGQFKTKARDWQRANLDTAAYLEYDPVAVGDKQAPPPMWQSFDPPVQSLNIGALSTADDIKAGSGYFDPSLGQQQVDQSGVALRQLQSRGDISNFHFIDNLGRSLKTAGEYLLRLIPLTYTTAREIEIVREDGKREVIMVNAPYKNARGVMQHHQLDVGKYSCTVQMGASYQTQREEVRTMLTQLSASNPTVAPLVMDVIFENWDFPGADRVARRFRAMLPAPVQQAEAAADRGVAPLVAQAQSQMQSMQGQIRQLQDLIKGKVLQIESKERQTTQTNIVRLLAAEAASKQQGAAMAFNATHEAVQAEMERKAGLLEQLLDLYAEDQQAQAERQHQVAMAQQAQQRVAQQAQQQQTGAAPQGLAPIGQPPPDAGASPGGAPAAAPGATAAPQV